MISLTAHLFFVLVMLFGEYRENPKFGKIVEDPYYGGKNGFSDNFDQLKHFSESFIQSVL